MSNFCASTGAARRRSASSSGRPPRATRAATPMLWMMSAVSCSVVRGVGRHHDRAVQDLERAGAHVLRVGAAALGVGRHVVGVHRGMGGAGAEQDLVPFGVGVAAGLAGDHAGEDLRRSGWRPRPRAGCTSPGWRSRGRGCSSARAAGRCCRAGRCRAGFSSSRRASPAIMPSRRSSCTFSMAPISSEARAPLPAKGISVWSRPCQ